MEDTGYLAIDLSVAPENLVHSISELLGVLRDIREKEITADELAMVVKGYLFDLEFSRDQPEALAVRYGWGLQAGYLRTFEQDIRELKELTPEYLQRVAREFIRLQGLKLVVVGPWTKDQRRAVEGVLKATPF
ncbi:MAG: insulinase family protein, partial [Desulfuromonadales bacterium]|nr:insulinase family protein [Desulfuromonadales bacterium]